MAAWGPPQTYGIGNDTVAWNPLGGPPPVSQFSMYQEVMVNSQSQGGWVPARVIEVYPDGTVTVEYVGTGFTKKIPIEHQDTQLKPAGPAPMPPMQGQGTVAAAPNYPVNERGMSRDWGPPSPGQYGGPPNGPVGAYGLPSGGQMGGPPPMGGPPQMGGPPPMGGPPMGGPPSYGGPPGGPPSYGGPPGGQYGGPQGPAYGAPPPGSVNAPSNYPPAGGFGGPPQQMGPGPGGPGFAQFNDYGQPQMQPPAQFNDYGQAPMQPPAQFNDYSPPPMQQPSQQMRMAQPPGMGGINAPSTLPVVNSYTAPSAAPAFASPIAAPSTVAQPAQISSLPTAAAPTGMAMMEAYEPGRTPLKTAAELGASPGAIVVRAPKAPKVYTAGMEVMILSDSSGGWVSGTVVGVDPDGTVTVQYGQNQKAIPKEHQATHISPKSGGMGGAMGMYGGMGGAMNMGSAPMAPAAALPTTAMPPSAGPTYAAAPANYAAQPATYAAAPQMPQEQGTVRYDLAQIAAINDQVEMSGFTGFQGAPQTYNPAPASMYMG